MAHTYIFGISKDRAIAIHREEQKHTTTNLPPKELNHDQVKAIWACQSKPWLQPR